MSEASNAAKDALPQAMDTGRLHQPHNDNDTHPDWVKLPAILMMVACAAILGVFIFSMIFLT